MALPFSLGKIDYIHKDDFDPPDVDWIDVTTLGSSFEHQIALNRSNLSRWRYPHTAQPWQREQVMAWDKEQQCSKCRHWSRHSERDSMGRCAAHRSDLLAEDDWCMEFVPKQES